jgi:hypothetical protein
MARVQHGADLTGPDTAAMVAFLESLTGTFAGKPIAEAPTSARTYAPPEAVTGTGTDVDTDTARGGDLGDATAEEAG